jgi:hypothetical protein
MLLVQMNAETGTSRAEPNHRARVAGRCGGVLPDDRIYIDYADHRVMPTLVTEVLVSNVIGTERSA